MKLPAFINWLFPLKFPKFKVGKRVQIVPVREDLKLPVVKKLFREKGTVLSIYDKKVLVSVKLTLDPLTSKWIDRVWLHEDSLHVVD